MRRRFQFGSFRVTVTNIDFEPAPWDNRGDNRDTYRDTYRVTVSREGIRHTCRAWGSIANAGHEDDHKAMGAMVVDELASAFCDPDEFWETAISDKRPSREQSKQVEQIIDKAAEFGEPLIAAAEELREKELT